MKVEGVKNPENLSTWFTYGPNTKFGDFTNFCAKMKYNSSFLLAKLRYEPTMFVLLQKLFIFFHQAMNSTSMWVSRRNVGNVKITSLTTNGGKWVSTLELCLKSSRKCKAETPLFCAHQRMKSSYCELATYVSRAASSTSLSLDNHRLDFYVVQTRLMNTHTHLLYVNFT